MSTTTETNGTQTAPVERVSRLQWHVAGHDTAYCKFGNYGPQGSGKTTTMAWIARLLARRSGKAAAYMIDSEGGSDYIASIFERQDMKLHVIKTREFGTLVEVFETMHASGEIVLVDSITHFWNNVVESYLKARNKTKIAMGDWNAIFETWRLFSKPFVNSRLHALVCGRMGYVYDNAVGDDGKLEFYKTDAKMKAGDQFGHEPALLFQMEQLDNAAAQDKLRQARTKEDRTKFAKEIRESAQIDFVCTIEKDRTRLLQGRRFVFTPCGDDEKDALAVEGVFRPVVEWHLKGTSHSGIQETGSTQTLLAPSGTEFDWQEKKRRREIALEELEALMVKAIPGQAGKDKALKGDVIERLFKTRSWTKVTDSPLERLEAVVAKTDGGVSEAEQVCQAAVTAKQEQTA